MKVSRVAAIAAAFLGCVAAAEGRMKPAEIAAAVQGGWKTALPESFRAWVSSPLVDAQLAAIPADKKTFGLKPRLELIYKSRQGFRFLTRSVDDYYVRLFAIYEGMVEQSGVLPAEERARKWDLEDEGAAEGGGRKIRAREKDGLPGDFVRLEYDPDWLVTRADYFEENRPAGSLQVQWSALGTNRVPARLELRMQQGAAVRTLEIRLEDPRAGGVGAQEFRGR